MPAIRQIVTWVQGFVDKLNSMDEGTKNTIVTIGLLAAAIGPVLIIIGKVVSAVGSIMTFIPTLIGGISSIGGGLSALWGILAANPVTLVIAAIAALIAIFVALWNNCEGYSNGVNYSNRECILIVAGGGGGGAIDNGTIHKGGAGMVPAVPWEGGRYPRGAVLPQTLVQRRLMAHPAAPAIQAAVAAGSAGTMACAESQAQEAPAMWTVSRHSPTTGNITQQRPGRG